MKGFMRNGQCMGAFQLNPLNLRSQLFTPLRVGLIRCADEKACCTSAASSLEYTSVQKLQFGSRIDMKSLYQSC